MNVMEAIQTRRSIRKYKPDPVEPEKLEQILQAMRLSPSARNNQQWKFFIVTDPAVKATIARGVEYSPELIEGAPALLAAAGTGDRIMNSGHLCSSVDLTIAMTEGILEATELGLGSCFVASHDETVIRQALGLSPEWRIPLISPLGYADEAPEPRPRKDFAEVAEIR